MMDVVRTAIAAFCGISLIFLAVSAQGHEYWVEPHKFEVEAGAAIRADLKNGENFEGIRLYYLTGRFTKFEVFAPSGPQPVGGYEGNQPALDHRSGESGLHVISYQSIFDRLTFDKADKFTAYLEEQGLDGILEEHAARGLPPTGFTEQYARSAKALVAVGDGAGADRLTGLPLELVALDNPYENAGDGAPVVVRLYWQGEPLADRQVLVFQYNGLSLRQWKLRTDDQGRAAIDVRGGGKFLLSSVYMFAGDDDPQTPTDEWVSYWASLTFAMPGADALLAPDASQPGE